MAVIFFFLYSLVTVLSYLPPRNNFNQEILFKRKTIDFSHPLSNKYSTLSSNDNNRQWLVSLNTPIHSDLVHQVNRYIEPYSLGQYIPHGTFLLTAPPSIVYSKVVSAPGVVNVIEMPAEVKMSVELYDKIFQTKNNEKIIQSNNNYIEILVQIVDSLNLLSLNVHYELIKPDLILFKIPAHQINETLTILLHNPSVHWIQERPQYKYLNKYAHAISQSFSSSISNTPIWNHGLRGENQVIGYADTGIDYDHCFFHDENHAIPFEHPNTEHRKVIYYHPYADQQDDEEGHGTHVGGTIAGEAVCKSHPEMADSISDYNGMAYKAKLCFQDIQRTGTRPGEPGYFVVIPGQISQQLFDDALKKCDAFIHSNSWGTNEDTPSTPYGISDVDIDQYVYHHPNFLPIFANGNEGRLGMGFSLCPACAKNVLAIGASRTSEEEFINAGKSVGIKINSPNIIANTYYLNPASFGRSWSELLPISSRILVKAIPFSGCPSINNTQELVGNIALIERDGHCTFTVKARNAHDAGAIAMIVVNNEIGDPVLMLPQSDKCLDCIPSAMISNVDGMKIVDNLENIDISIPVNAPPSAQLDKEYMASFSSRGPLNDGRIKPDIVAVGDSLTSAKSDGHIGTLNQCGNSFLVRYPGTSMATPNTAGNIALLRQYFIEGYYPTGVKGQNPSIIPSASLMKALAINSAISLKGFVAGSPVYRYADYPNHHPSLQSSFPIHDPRLPVIVTKPPSYIQGYGHLKLDNVLYFNDSSFQLYLLNEEHSLDTNDIDSFCFDVHSLTIPFKVTVVWTDPPPDAASKYQLINDIDLSLLHIGSKNFFLGNNLVSTTYFLDSVPFWDTLNNVEQIWLSSRGEYVFHKTPILNGKYLVQIRGSHIPIGPQNYSLVVTGDFSLLSIDECPLSCSSNCYGHGTCNQGLCQCNTGYYGYDCQQATRSMKLDGNIVNLDLKNRGWAHFYVDISKPPSNKTHFYIMMQRTSFDGEPQLYVKHGSPPDLIHHDISETRINDHGFINHNILIKDDQYKIGRYYIGVYAAPPYDTKIKVQIRTELPIAPDIDEYYWLKIGLIALGIIAFIGLIIYFIIYKVYPYYQTLKQGFRQLKEEDINLNQFEVKA